MMERSLALVLGKPELWHLAKQCLHVERVFQRLVDRRVRRPRLQRRRRRAAFLRLVLGLWRPLRFLSPASSSSGPVSCVALALALVPVLATGLPFCWAL